MLFRKKVDPRCTYCEKGIQLNDSQVICIKRGVVSAGYHCRSFIYAPLKRTPPKPVALDFSHFKDQDFTL